VTESVTLVAQTHVPEAVLEEAGACFTPEERARLVYAVIEINAWNRLAIAMGTPEPGSYEPARAPR